MTPFHAHDRYIEWNFTTSDAGEPIAVHGASFVSFHASAPVELHGSYDGEFWFRIVENEILEGYVEQSLNVNFIYLYAPAPCKVQLKTGAI